MEVAKGWTQIAGHSGHGRGRRPTATNASADTAVIAEKTSSGVDGEPESAARPAYVTGPSAVPAENIPPSIP